MTLAEAVDAISIARRRCARLDAGRVTSGLPVRPAQPLATARPVGEFPIHHGDCAASKLADLPPFWRIWKPSARSFRSPGFFFNSAMCGEGLQDWCCLRAKRRGPHRAPARRC